MYEYGSCKKIRYALAYTNGTELVSIHINLTFIMLYLKIYLIVFVITLAFHLFIFVDNATSIKDLIRLLLLSIIWPITWIAFIKWVIHGSH